MIAPNETFNGTYPFKPNFFDGQGFKMHYVDEGEGEPIICLHGQPTWSYLYRNFIPTLSKTHRVIAPDMMGYGKSETNRRNTKCYVYLPYTKSISIFFKLTSETTDFSC